MSNPLIEFPSLFPIKIIGFANEAFEGKVIEILNQHVPDLGEAAVSLKLSKNEKYLSMTATIMAQSQEQLDGLYQALSDEPLVMVVL